MKWTHIFFTKDSRKVFSKIEKYIVKLRMTFSKILHKILKSIFFPPFSSLQIKIVWFLIRKIKVKLTILWETKPSSPYKHTFPVQIQLNTNICLLFDVILRFSNRWKHQTSIDFIRKSVFKMILIAAFVVFNFSGIFWQIIIKRYTFKFDVEKLLLSRKSKQM